MTKMYNRRSALRARASALAVITGLALMAGHQRAMAAGPFTINPAYNASSCVLNVNSQTVSADGFGRSILIQSDGFLGDNAKPGLTVDASTLSGSFVNEGTVSFGPPGCSNSGAGSILTFSGAPAAAEFKNSTVTGGVVNKNAVNSTQHGIAFEGSILGVNSNAPSVVVFENTGAVTANKRGVSMVSSSVYGTIGITSGFVQGGAGAGIHLENMTVLTGGIEVTGIVKSLQSDAIYIDDTTVGTRVFNSKFGQIIGSVDTGTGAGISLVGNVTVTDGLQNEGAISGYHGVKFLTSSYVGGIINRDQGTIVGSVDGITGLAGSFQGGIQNQDKGTIEGLNGFGIRLAEPVSPAGGGIFSGSIFNDTQAKIQGDVGGILLDFGTIDSEFNNQGEIKTTGSGFGPFSLTGGAAAWFNASVEHKGSYTNSGTIDGTSRSGASGLVLSGGAINANIENKSGGTISGSSQSGGIGIFVAANSLTGDIINSGTVNGFAGIVIGPNMLIPASLEASNIDIDGNVTNSGSVNGIVQGVFVSANEWTGNFLNGTGASISASSGQGLTLVAATMNGNIDNQGTVNNGTLISADTWTGDLTTGLGSIISNNSGSGLLIGSGDLGETNALAMSDLIWTGDVTNNGEITGATNGASISLDTFTGSFVNNGTFSGSAGTGLAIFANTWQGNWENAAGGTMQGGSTGAVINVGQFNGNATNNGLISGGGVDTGWHIIAENFVGDITNNDTLVATGNALHVEVTTMSGSIANNATITGGANLSIADWTGNFTTAAGSNITNANGVALQIGGREIQQLGEFNIVATESNLNWTGDFNSQGTVSGSTGGLVLDVNEFNGSWTNSGEISADDGSSSAVGLTIYANTWNGNWTNASGAEISGTQTGLYFEADDVTGTFTNQGKITGGASTTAQHIVANTFTGDIINDITGELEAPSLALHLEINQLNGDVNNAGLIKATASDGIAALLKSNGGSGSYAGEVFNSGTIEGSTLSGTGLRIETSVDEGVRNEGTLKGKTAYDTTDAAGATSFVQQGANSLVEGDMRLSTEYADDVTFKGGALRGSIYGNGVDDDVSVDVGSGNAFAFNDNTVTGINAFTAQSGATLLGTLTAGTDGLGMTMDAQSVTVKNGAELYLDDNTVVTTQGLDLESAATLTYYLTQNVNQHGVINVIDTSLLAFGNLAESAQPNFGIAAAPGVANIGGNLQVFLSDYNSFRTSGTPSFLYTGVLQAAGGINGTFNPAVYAGSVPLGFQYDIETIYNPTSLDILLTRTPFNDLIEDPTGNQQGVGDALEDICANADENSALADFCNYVGLLEEDEIPGAYDEVAGSQLPQVAGLGLDLAELLTLPSNENNVHGTAFGTCQQAGFGWCGTQQYAALASPAQATDAMSDEDPFAWLRPGKREVGRNGVWGRYVGNWRNLEGDQSARGLRAQTNGFGTGFDHVLSENLMVGVAGLYADTTSKFSGRPADEGDIKTYQAGAYASWGDADFYVNVNSTAIWNEFETRRRIQTGFATFEFADGDFDGFGGTAFVEMGSVIEADGVRFQPLASLFYMTHTTDEFTETGAPGLNLVVREATTESLRSQLGGRLSYPFKWGDSRIVPEIRAAWRHEFLDVRQDSWVNFEGAVGPDFKIIGSEQSRDMAVFGVGLSASLGRYTVLYSDVDGAFNADKTSVQASIGLRHSW